MTDESTEVKPATADSPFRLSLLKDPLEVLAKAAAALLVIFYILGFLVVSTANYKHGITNFGLFRVRVVSAGVLVALFSGAAFWLWQGAFGLRTPLKEHARTPLLLPFKCLTFLVAVRFTSWFLNGLIFGAPPSRYAGWRVLLYVLCVAVIAIPTQTKQKYPIWFSSLCWVMIVIFVGVELAFEWKAGVVDQVFLWFLSFAVLAETTKTNFTVVNTIRDVNWLMLTVDLVAVPILFGTVLFEKIPPRFGGGQPVSVLFQFSGTSPIDGAVKDKFWLVDEGDSGFYVLQAPEDKKGIFLPRSSVAAIYYDADSNAAHLPWVK
jgi:hypothetical protein